MRLHTLRLIFMFMFYQVIIYGQQVKMSYQAVFRDSSGELLTERLIGIRLSILNEKAELTLIQHELTKRWDRFCVYCKHNGHKFNDCPVRARVKERCNHDNIRTKICNRVSNDMRIKMRQPLGTLLKKRS